MTSASSIAPVHLELAVGVLVVVLIGAPAEFEHRIANLADHVVAAHQRRLVVAGLRLGVGGVADRRPVGAEKEELAFHAGLELVAGLGGLGDHPLQDIARRVLDRLAVHVGVGGEPADLGFPRQLDQARRIGNGENVGVGRASCRASWQSRQIPRRPWPCRRWRQPARAWREACRTNRHKRSRSTLSRARGPRLQDRLPCDTPSLDQ